jgi:hypothetical protein
VTASRMRRRSSTSVARLRCRLTYEQAISTQNDSLDRNAALASRFRDSAVGQAERGHRAESAALFAVVIEPTTRASLRGGRPPYSRRSRHHREDPREYDQLNYVLVKLLQQVEDIGDDAVALPERRVILPGRCSVQALNRICS